MAKQVFSKTQKIILVIVLFVFASVLLTCSSKKEECVDPPSSTKKAASQQIKGKKVSDWCRTCVMGPKGWASCQTVYAQNDKEARDSVKARSLEQACLDSGFEKGVCPEKALISSRCKGDPPPTRGGAPKALQKAFFNKQLKQSPKPNSSEDHQKKKGDQEKKKGNFS